VSVELEPDTEDDKTDILWIYNNNASKATQVKSSQNQIGLADATAWAQSLHDDKPAATQHELILIGPCAQAVVDAGVLSGVTIPLPKSLDLLGLFQQAAHKLDIYLESKQISSLPVAVRELIVDGLIGKFSGYSTGGNAVSRAELDRLLTSWILMVLPHAVKVVMYSHCEVLGDTVILPATVGMQHEIPEQVPILLPLEFLNPGDRPSIVETVALRVRRANVAMLYEPLHIVDLHQFMKDKVVRPGNVKKGFSTFGVMKGGLVSEAVLFYQVDNPPAYPFAPWEAGGYSFDLFVHYRGDAASTKALSLRTSFLAEDLAAGSQGGSVIHQAGVLPTIPEEQPADGAGAG